MCSLNRRIPICSSRSIIQKTESAMISLYRRLNESVSKLFIMISFLSDNNVFFIELVQNTPEEESSPITPPEASEPEEPLVEEPVVEKPVVENKMSVYTFVIVLILWSVLMVYFGSYLSNHS